MSPQYTPHQPHLICVYNADTGLIEALMHAVHKAMRPATYPCSLCALTFGAVSMRSDWKAFWRGLNAKVSFYHRDDFTRDFPTHGTGGEYEVRLPAILIGEGGKELRVVISSAELDAMANVDELMERVQAVLEPVTASPAPRPLSRPSIPRGTATQRPPWSPRV